MQIGRLCRSWMVRTPGNSDGVAAYGHLKHKPHFHFSQAKGYSPNALTRCALVCSPLVESRRWASP